MTTQNPLNQNTTLDSSASISGTLAKITEMLKTQAQLNCRVADDWEDRGFDWATAMVTEGAELMQHMGWHWWKKSPKVDLDQARMEAVDIWHFLLSQLMEDMPDGKVQDLFSQYSSLLTSADGLAESGNVSVDHVLGAAKRFLAKATERHVNEEGDLIIAYSDLIKTLGIDFDELYRLYIGKTQLNALRWANDYGKGYTKDWDGEEDNEYLTRLLGTLDVNSLTYAQDIHDGLSKRYAEIQDLAKQKTDAFVEENYDLVAEKL